MQACAVYGNLYGVVGYGVLYNGFPKTLMYNRVLPTTKQSVLVIQNCT